MRTSNADLCVAYDGEALKDNSIDVRDLAPALLGIGQLLEETNRVINGDRATVAVKVKAHREGSFEIHLDVFQSLARQLESILVGDQVTAAVNLIELLGFSAGIPIGVFKLIKWMKKRRARLSKGALPGTVIIEIDGERLEVSREVVKLSEDIGVRKAIQRMLEPLSNPGIDKFEVREGAVPIEVITRADVEFFDIPVQAENTEDVLPDRRWTQAFSLVTVTFKEDNKWRLTDGGTTIGATMADADFLRRVEARTETFAKGDVLVCDMKAMQVHRSDGLHTEYQIEKVVEHRQHKPQLRLFEDVPRKD